MNNLAKVIALGGRRLNKALAMHYLFAEQGIPKGYIPLAYIKSTDTQYIDLGIKPSDDMEFEIEYQVISGSGKLYGADVSNNIFDAFNVTPTSGTLRAFKHSSGETLTNITTVANEKVALKVVVKDGTYSTYINGEIVDTKPAVGTPPDDTMYLFACHRYGVADAKIKAIVWSCRVKKSGEFVGDFKPYLNDNGEAGLLNTADMKFHKNLGTGVFAYEYSIDSYVHDRMISFADAEFGLDGSTLKNLVGNDYDMTITGSLPYADKGLTFNGTAGNYINVPEYTELANTAELTFEMAMNLTNIQSTQRVLFLAHFFEFYIRNGKLNTDFYFDGLPIDHLEGNANTGFITFAAAFKANSYQRLFINGVQVASISSTSPSSVPASGWIGQGSNRYPVANDSKFYSMRVYKRALTNEEIAQNFEIDKARFGLTETASVMMLGMPAEETSSTVYEEEQTIIDELEVTEDDTI